MQPIKNTTGIRVELGHKHFFRRGAGLFRALPTRGDELFFQNIDYLPNYYFFLMLS